MRMVPSHRAADDNSDYGSDFDEDDLHHLHDSITSPPLGHTAAEDSESQYLQPVLPETLPGDDRAPVAHVPLGSSPRSSGVDTSVWRENRDPAITVQVEEEGDYERGAGLEANRSTSPRASQLQFDTSTPNPATDPSNDSRSPLQRFRTPPKKPLSVTDLVSPAWCELQYFYSLSRYGRVKRTFAMKKGSKVHKVLEEQVHVSVPVEVTTKEDTWGLRVWNVIQGLRTMRRDGMTREMEVWGVVGGQVVNGVIDELSFSSTDPELEGRLTSEVKGDQAKLPDLPPGQTDISSFFGDKSSQDIDPTKGGAHRSDRKIFLMDVKTRASSRLPNETSMRPTRMQLMLYRKLLGNLAANSVNADIIFERYKLDPTRAFSDSLVAQLSNLDFSVSSQQAEPDSSMADADAAGPGDDTVTELLSHNSLRQLWSLMIQEFQLTIPSGTDSISKVLKVEFRSSKDSNVLGVKTFPYQGEEFDRYVDDVMAWWKGERETKGVEVEEAFKCRICEFAEGCDWRKKKVDDAVLASRSRLQAQAATAVDA